MYLATIAHGSPAYDVTVQLRDEILRRPLGLIFTVADLAAEADSYHLAAYDKAGGELLACLILTPKNPSEIQMRQVAVARHLQGKGVGRQLVAYSEQVARENGFQKMILHARDTAIPFYDRLGYWIVGAEFYEVGIPHRFMEKLL